MTQNHWQDARLKKALEHAPDRDQKPSPQVREHILCTAAQALQPTTQKTAIANWGKTFRQLFLSPSRMPWNAAWGTALLITCVGAVWLFQNPKTAFEPQLPAHFPQQPASITLQGGTSEISAPILETVTAPEPISATGLMDDSSQPNPTTTSSLGTPPILENSQGISASSKSRAIQEHVPLSQNRQQEREQPQAEHYFEVPALSSPAPTSAPVARTPVPMLIEAEKTQETVMQPMERSKVTSSHPAQPTPDFVEQNIIGNYNAPPSNLEARYSHAQSAATGATAPVQVEPNATSAADIPLMEMSTSNIDSFAVQESLTEPLLQALPTALQHWQHLQLSFEGHSGTLYRSQSAPLPEVLLRIIEIHTVLIRSVPKTDATTMLFTFYSSDNTSLGILAIQPSGAWFFYSEQPSALTGQLSQSQRQQLENILKTLFTQ